MVGKKAQHEIVGFILIVVIVVVIGLFLLVFYLRQEPVEYKSLNVQNFLQSGMSYTTECAVSFEPQYQDLEDLIKSCRENRKCLNDKMACEVLEKEMSELVQESWMVSPDRQVNSYFLIIYYEEKSRGEENGKKAGVGSVKDEILSLQEGNCTGNKAGAENFLHYGSGNIIINMEICYV